MEYNGKVLDNKALKKIDQNIVNLEVKPSIKDIIQEKYITVSSKHRGKPRNMSLDFNPLTLKLNYMTNLTLGLQNDRFIPILEKPSLTGASSVICEILSPIVTENIWKRPTIKKCKIDNNINQNVNVTANNKDLQEIKRISKSHKISIELFFASIAETVLNLPEKVQTDIKLQICEIVHTAEAKYSIILDKKLINFEN